MANFEIYGVGNNIQQSENQNSDSRPFYLVPTEFGIINPDGTRTYFHGTGFTYDWVRGVFTGGTVTRIAHYDANGLPLDQITGLSVAATSLQARFFDINFANLGLRAVDPSIFSGDDTIDARVRAGNAVVDDVISAGGGNDTVYAGSGNDTVNAGSGNDTVYAGSGNDTVNGGAGNDKIWGGTGDDNLLGGDGDDAIYGEAGFDSILGGDGADLIRGGADNDVVGGQTGADTIYGDAGNDQLYGDEGNDTLWGGTGDDGLFGGTGADVMDGEDGNDNMDGGSGDDKIYGANGNDILRGGATGNDLLDGGAWNDVLIGDDLSFAAAVDGKDTLVGLDGNDVLWGKGANDRLDGGLGTDAAIYTLTNFADLKITKTTSGFTVTSALEGTDTLISVEQIVARDGTYSYNTTSGLWIKTSTITADQRLATSGIAAESVIAYGTAGNDVKTWTNTPGGASGDASPDVYFAGNGNDTVTFSASLTDPSSGQHGTAAAFGEAGNDILTVDTSNVDLLTFGTFYLNGGIGNDILSGGLFDDTLVGGAGADMLTGNRGNDMLEGGAGADTFVFDRQVISRFDSPVALYNGFGDDVIADFVVGTDKLQISNAQSVSLTDTVEGLLVTVRMWQDSVAESTGDPSQPGAVTINTILLQGVRGAYTLADLTLQPSGTVVSGTAGADVINSAAYPAAREFLLLGGDDSITLEQANLQGASITVRGGDGNDTIKGPAGPSFGDPRFSYSTVLLGDAGNDQITGGDQVDTLNGGAGNDVLTGGLGVDTLTGGSGADVFVFQTRSESRSGTPSSGNDIITDFEVGIDSIAVIKLFSGAGNGIGLAENATGTAVSISDVGTIQLQGVFGITVDDLYV